MTRPAKTATTRPSPMATCAQGAAVWAYLDGELSAVQARAMARHVHTCAACAARARRLRAMLDACRSAGCKKLPADVRSRARARARELMRARPPRLS